LIKLFSVLSSAGIAAISGCSSAADDRLALDRQDGFICEVPGKVSYQAWGPRGLSKGCESVTGAFEGSFFAAEYGRVVIRGAYKGGSPDGLWEWFDSDGKLTRREITHERMPGQK
jgi:hypothetical protein